LIKQQEIDAVVERIVKEYQPQKVILFGSYADGHPQEDSDLDLLLIKDTHLPRFKRAREVNRLFNPYPFAMDILVYSTEEIKKWQHHKSSFIAQVLKTGKLLYG